MKNFYFLNPITEIPVWFTFFYVLPGAFFNIEVFAVFLIANQYSYFKACFLLKSDRHSAYKFRNHLSGTLAACAITYVLFLIYETL